MISCVIDRCEWLSTLRSPQNYWVPDVLHFEVQRPVLMVLQRSCLVYLAPLLELMLEVPSVL
jgi:hypothetical protein